MFDKEMKKANNKIKFLENKIISLKEEMNIQRINHEYYFFFYKLFYIKTFFHIEQQR